MGRVRARSGILSLIQVLYKDGFKGLDWCDAKNGPLMSMYLFCDAIPSSSNTIIYQDRLGTNTRVAF
jgi:hypothetical protein